MTYLHEARTKIATTPSGKEQPPVIPDCRRCKSKLAHPSAPCRSCAYCGAMVAST